MLMDAEAFSRRKLKWHNTKQKKYAHDKFSLCENQRFFRASLTLIGAMAASTARQNEHECPSGSGDVF